MNGKIIRIISNLYTVKCDNNKKYLCRARGKFRNNSITPLVGDNVLIDEKNCYILEILKRENELERPNVVNVDNAIIVSTLKKPDFSSFLLDKMLTNIILAGIEPIIVFTKYDLLSDEEKDLYNKIIDYYNSIGICTYVNTDIEKIVNKIDKKIVVLTGQTGAGKSTLINKIEPNLNLKTDDISYALGRGKHTTRHVELYEIKKDNYEFYLVDTPGFSALDSSSDKDNLKFAFFEFDNNGCKFRDCKHINEKGCKVIEQYDNGKILQSRYENYRKMVIGDDSGFLFKK